MHRRRNIFYFGEALLPCSLSFLIVGKTRHENKADEDLVKIWQEEDYVHSLRAGVCG